MEIKGGFGRVKINKKEIFKLKQNDIGVGYTLFFKNIFLAILFLLSQTHHKRENVKRGSMTIVSPSDHSDEASFNSITRVNYRKLQIYKYNVTLRHQNDAYHRLAQCIKFYGRWLDSFISYPCTAFKQLYLSLGHFVHKLTANNILLCFYSESFFYYHNIIFPLFILHFRTLFVCYRRMGIRRSADVAKTPSTTPKLVVLSIYIFVA